MSCIKDREIIQIMPADRWHAIYKDDEGDISTPLAAWALIKDWDDETDEMETRVVGLDASEGTLLLCCDSVGNFKGYKQK